MLREEGKASAKGGGKETVIRKGKNAKGGGKECVLREKGKRVDRGEKESKERRDKIKEAKNT